MTNVDPIYGLQLNNPRFLEFIGANPNPRETAVAAALHLQRDADLMTSNMQVLGQLVTSLNRMSSEILRMAVGPEVFSSTMMDVASPVPQVPHAAHYMAAMGLWRPPDGLWAPGPLPGSSCNSCMNCNHSFPRLPWFRLLLWTFLLGLWLMNYVINTFLVYPESGYIDFVTLFILL